jgi:hypothetical protein
MSARTINKIKIKRVAAGYQTYKNFKPSTQHCLLVSVSGTAPDLRFRMAPLIRYVPVPVLYRYHRYNLNIWQALEEYFTTYRIGAKKDLHTSALRINPSLKKNLKDILDMIDFLIT